MTFYDLVKQQFMYGGKKYAHDEVREATDILFEKHGKNWLIGTVDKYCFRYKNLKQEKDLLKIACYQYILWLKRGFFVMPNGINSPAIDTNVKIKEEMFPEFLHRYELAKTIKEKQYYGDWTNIDTISNLLGDFSHKEWPELTQDNLFTVFYYAQKEWEETFKDVEVHNTDCK